jgi:hypothetical protein
MTAWWAASFDPSRLHHPLAVVVLDINHSQFCRNVKDMCAKFSGWRGLCWQRRGKCGGFVAQSLH